MAENKGKRAGAWIIMILLFVGLVGFGGSGLTGTVRSIGKVGDKPISVQSYANALGQQIDAFSAQIGTTVSFSQAEALGLDQSVRAQLVAERVLDNEAAQMGLSVGDTRVAERVRNFPAFQGLSGGFDREQYRDVLSRNGLTEKEFETTVREEFARSLLQAAVISGIPAPDAYADALTAFIGERRDFGWALVTDAVLDGPLPEATEEELLAHYEANPEAYTLPERRVISYAAVVPEDIQGDVDVDAQAVRDLYDARIDEYVQPERRLVERLVFSNTDAATAALARVTEGETDFDGLVEDRGLDLSDVDMGDVAADELGAAGDAVFAAAPGDVVGPFDTALGPALFRMNAVLQAQEITFDQAEGDLRAELAQDRARRVIDSARSEIEDLMAGGASVEDLAERTVMTAGTIEWSEGSAEGIAAYQAFRSAAATVQDGAFLELTDLSDGGLFVLRLDEVIPAEVQPLDAVRNEVIVDRAAAARSEAIIAAAEAIAADVNDNATPFSEAGLSGFAEVDIIRRDFIAGAPQGILQAVFDMTPGEARVVTDETGLIAVVRLDAVKEADMESDTMAAERAAIAEQVGQGIAQDIYSAYSGAVQARTEVTINQSAVTAVHSNFQ